ncbi:alpha/beta hydrolase [Sanguibacter sp. 25GB23B1]|uniref:alpha/beta hydrolase n=1 Tax=unclassified Sanguibacter TaxID=2645534 RepID=UPI0032AF3663
MTAGTSFVGLRPPFDPQVARALDENRADVVTGMTAAEIVPLRERAEPPTLDELTLSGAYVLSEHSAPGPGGAVPLVLLRPATPTATPRPVLLHLHGGGLVTGDALSDGPGMVELASGNDMAVLSVGYRLAPEHPYPAAVEDAYAALLWLAEQADLLGLDGARTVVSGVSAGGGLAAALALLVRQRGGPPLLGQLLICPMLDDRSSSASAVQMEGHGSWDRTANTTAWAAYLGALAGGPDVPETAAPARARDLRDLPPAFVDVGSAETFRDECVDYAARIWACGGDAELHVWPGGCHAFDFLDPTADLSCDAREARGRWLRRLLARPVRTDHLERTPLCTTAAHS